MSHAPDLSAELRATLFNLRETRPGSHIYLLLDNACPVSPEHPLHPAQLAQRPISRQRAQLFGDAPTQAREWQPVLVQLHRAGENGYVDEELIDFSLVTAAAQCTSINGAYVSAWIASDADSGELAAHLSRACRTFDASQGASRRIALYEPHRMALLADAPGEDAFLRAFLRPISLWVFVDAAGSLRTLNLVDRAPEAAPAAWRMSLSMSRTQGRVPLARLALLGAVKGGLPIPAHAETTLDGLLIEADRLGLTDAEDVVFFALNGLTLAPRWHAHPQALQCIAQSRDEGAPLAGLMAGLPDDVLDEIGAYGRTR